MKNVSILAQDDTNSFVSVELQCTRQGFSVNNAMLNEMMDALQPLNQKFPVTNENLVHRNRALIKIRTLRRQVKTAREFIM